MRKKPLTNYKKKLAKYFKIYGKMLDVGCGARMTFLYQFDESAFDKLIGIDINMPSNTLYPYVKSKPKTRKLDIMQGFIKRLEQRYELYKVSVQDYEIKENEYGFIFCRHLLHFIEFEKQNEIIKKLLAGLKHDGILFLKINHSKNELYQDKKKVSEIGLGIFQVNEGYNQKGQIHYVSNPEKIKRNIKDNFKYEYLRKDKTTVTIILRK